MSHLGGKEGFEILSLADRLVEFAERKPTPEDIARAERQLLRIRSVAYRNDLTNQWRALCLRLGKVRDSITKEQRK